MSARLLMQAAAEVARLAGKVALRHYPGPHSAAARLAIEVKADGSPVTVADRAAERAARDWIERRFPGDGIHGEEFGIARPEAQRRWLLDPIDGTRTFVRGVPLWGTLVAVVESERVLAGVAFFPALDEIVAAAPGEGCWWNDTRCAVSEVTDLAAATVVTTDEHFGAAPAARAAWDRLAGCAALSRSWGDCYGYLLVATGRAEAMLDAVLSPWDAAAALPIVEEAGGVFTDWNGTRSAFGGSAVATNRRLAEPVRTLLALERVTDLAAAPRLER